MTAAEWAQRVPADRFPDVRHELDEQVLRAAPGYAESVRRLLDEYTAAALADRQGQAASSPAMAARALWRGAGRVRVTALVLSLAFTLGAYTLVWGLKPRNRLTLVEAQPYVALDLAVAAVATFVWAAPAWRGVRLPGPQQRLAVVLALIGWPLCVALLLNLGDDGIEPRWALLTCAGAVASGVALIPVLRARFTPLDRLYQDRLAAAYAALGDEQRALLAAEYAAAADVLRRRGIETGPDPSGHHLPGAWLLAARTTEAAR